MPRVFAHFLVCTNRRPHDHPLPSCGARGSMTLFEAFTRALAERGYPSGVKVTATGCLTPCRQGPNVVVYPEGIWYRGVTPTDVPEILTAHLDGDEPVTRLLLPEEVRVS
ncbi:MAG: (2Fe-2S) ferredoxin domain-containing protein [Armatimonadota bacterium]|nr:(2Fe-2S) ferredoxin domain-containing protein [Armatimonadota bacterium]